MLQFLFSPTKQFLYDSGKLLAGGKIYVYLKDTQNLATLYDGETGEGKSNPIVLDANGRASVKADDVNEYRLEIYTPYDTLVYTCNAFYADGGEGGGTFIVRHDETLSGNGTSQNPLGVINIPLAVDDTMTAYTDIVEGVSSLVLGVNGDWFNDTFGSALNDKVDWSSFSACCSAVKGGLDNKLDASAYDLSNYYNKQETTYLLSNYYNKQEIDETVNVINQLKQDKLTFGYDENSAISSINNSALAGSQGELVPWISGAKILADTQTLTDNMIVQVLSSFTLSGNKNHCIAVKGGVYRFPNKWEIASGIAETNYFMPQSAMSGYIPASSFTSYTASVANNLESNWNYTNSAYSLSINNFYNKLDISAFSSWSANLDLSGDYIPTSASGSFYPMTGNPSGFLTAHQDISNLATKDELVDTSSFLSASISSISSFVSGNDDKYYPLTGNPSGFLTAHQDLSDYATTSVVNNISSYLSGEIDNKLDKSESGNYYPMIGNPSGFLTAHQSLDDYYKKTETSSKEEISAAIAAIPLGDAEVNNVVRSFSANGTWLTAHQDLSNYATTSQLEQVSAAVSSMPTLSGGEGVQLVNEDNITRIDLGLSAGSNMSFVYDQESNTIRMDCEATDGNSAVNNYVETHSATINGMANSAWAWNQVVDIIRTYSGQWLLANP